MEGGERRYDGRSEQKGWVIKIRQRIERCSKKKATIVEI